jgi:hypothetical protein
VFALLSHICFSRRYIGAVLFLFVFTLPLHFHPATESSQISQECGCYYGGRTQLGPMPAPVVLVPASEVVLLVAHTTKTPPAVVAEAASARAPPYFL